MPTIPVGTRGWAGECELRTLTQLITALSFTQTLIFKELIGIKWAIVPFNNSSLSISIVYNTTWNRQL